MLCVLLVGYLFQATQAFLLPAKTRSTSLASSHASPLRRRASCLYSMLDKGGNKRRRPRPRNDGEDDEDADAEKDDYQSMRPAALDRPRFPPPRRPGQPCLDGMCG